MTSSTCQVRVFGVTVPILALAVLRYSVTVELSAACILLLPHVHLKQHDTIHVKFACLRYMCKKARKPALAYWYKELFSKCMKYTWRRQTL